jgi:predicted benzoate:H+ symporter BenE
MAEVSTELTKRATAYVAGLSFAGTYLTSAALGASMYDSLARSCGVALCALIAGRLLVRPVVDVVLDALARDEARRAAENQAAEDEA